MSAVSIEDIVNIFSLFGIPWAGFWDYLQGRSADFNVGKSWKTKREVNVSAVAASLVAVKPL